MTIPGVALIGVGMVGDTFANALKGLEGRVRLTGVMGRRPESGQAFLDRQGLKGRAYNSVDEIAVDGDVSFVILATPPNARTEIVRTLVRAGKPILMEKPIERTLAAAREICAICESEGVPLGIVLQHRARPSVGALQERLGDAGPLQAVEIHVPWWRPQSYYNEPGRGTYERDGGGVLLTQAIHVIDLALQFTGPVREVMGLTGTTGFHTLEAEDFASAGLVFENGALGSLMASTASFPGRGGEIFLHYKAVSARLASNLLELHWQDGRLETFGTETATGAGADPMAFGAELHAAVVADFADAVEAGRAPLAPGRSALRVHGLIEAIEASSRSGQRVVVEAE
jgi:predicted dehydrogenase